MGGLFEEVVEANGTVKQRSHVGDFLIDERSGPVETPTISRRYLIRDNLGSVSVILDDHLADGLVSSILSSPSYDAFGAEATSTRFNASADVANMTRGYTDHEQFDDLGIIHMNGRIYDADLGRFLSADPLVPHPYFSQSYNRYSYVLNNPLSLTDPTGFEDDKCKGIWGDVPLEWVDENDICIDGNFCNSQPTPVSAPKGPTLINQYTQNPSTRAYHFVEKRMSDFKRWDSAPEFSRDWDRQTFANVGSAVAPDAVASGEVGGWTMEGIRAEYSGNAKGQEFLNYMKNNPVTIISFEGATDTYTNSDGSTEVVDLSTKLRGNYRDGAIRLNKSLTTRQAAETLYHEYQHQAGQDEVNARISTEQFAIDMGWPETRSGYRGSNGAPNIKFILEEINANDHYSPKVKRPRVRNYINEKIIIMN